MEDRARTTSAAIDVDVGLNVVKEVGGSVAVRPRSTAVDDEESAAGGRDATTRLSVHVQRAADADSGSSTLTSSSPSQTVTPPSADVVTRRVPTSGGVAAPAGEYPAKERSGDVWWRRGSVYALPAIWVWTSRRSSDVDLYGVTGTG